MISVSTKVPDEAAHSGRSATDRGCHVCQSESEPENLSATVTQQLARCCDMPATQLGIQVRVRCPGAAT
jgi:hypothetical protein